MRTRIKPYYRGTSCEQRSPSMAGKGCFTLVPLDGYTSPVPVVSYYNVSSSNRRCRPWPPRAAIRSSSRLRLSKDLIEFGPWLCQGWRDQGDPPQILYNGETRGLGPRGGKRYWADGISSLALIADQAESATRGSPGISWMEFPRCRQQYLRAHTSNDHDEEASLPK